MLAFSKCTLHLHLEIARQITHTTQQTTNVPCLGQQSASYIKTLTTQRLRSTTTVDSKTSSADRHDTGDEQNRPNRL